MLSNSSKRVAVITGAGRGIGLALTELLIAQGYLVVAVVRNPDQVAALSEQFGASVLPLLCDVTSNESETILSEFLSKHVEKVHLLVNNAGFGASKYGVMGLRFEELDNVLAVSCHGPIRCVRACLPFLRAAQGAVVLNISSRFGSVEWVATETVPADQATYAYRIGKAAMNMFTSCLSVELRPDKIRVLSIDPGKVKTRFGPVDADTEAADAARSIIELVESNSATGLFLHASGEKLPW